MDNNNKSFKKGILYGAVAMLIVVMIGCGIWKVALGRKQASDPLTVQAVESVQTSDKLNELGKIINDRYLFTNHISKQALQDGIYSGYVSALGDPYTVYYNKKQMKELMESTSGKYSGIGAVLTKDPSTGAVTIVNVYKGSSAEKSGLKAGDILYKVDDHEIKDQDLTEIVSWVKGKEGTDVTLSVLRGAKGEKVECKATRKEVETNTVEHEMKAGNTGYIHVTEFDTVTYTQFKNALDDLEKQGMTGLVIDLRGNPGGNLDTAIDMLKLILPKGVIVSTKDKYGKKEEYTNEKDHRFQKPLVVLVDQNSASASEIFSGAVQDYKVGKIVGMTTFGKGIVQQLFDLGDGTCVKVTVSQYFTPKGRNINKKGITPDVEVKYSPDPNNKKADNQLEKALEVVQSDKQ